MEAMTFVSNTSTDMATDLHGHTEAEDFSYFLKYIPGFIFLLILCCIGTVGNVHAILVYWLRFKSSNRRTAVITLATVDLVNCVVSMPRDMIVIRYNYSSTSNITCKLFLFIVHVISLASTLLLLVIALERFRKVCQPLKRQVARRTFRIICLLVIFVSVVISLPTLVLFRTVSQRLEPSELVTEVCGADNEVLFQSYYCVLSVIICVSLTICIVIYITLGKRVRKMQNRIVLCKSSSFSVQDSTIQYPMNATRKSRSFGNIHSLILKSNEGTETGKKQTTSTQSLRITRVFLVATIVSYVGVITTGVVLVIRSIYGMNRKLEPAFDVLYRFHFINNVANPIVYCFMDCKFRQQCEYLYKQWIKKIRTCFNK